MRKGRTSFGCTGSDVQREDPFLPGNIVLESGFDGSQSQRGEQRNEAMEGGKRRRRADSGRTSPFPNQVFFGIFSEKIREHCNKQEEQSEWFGRWEKRKLEQREERDGLEGRRLRARAHLSLHRPFRSYRFVERFYSICYDLLYRWVLWYRLKRKREGRW